MLAIRLLGPLTWVWVWAIVVQARAATIAWEGPAGCQGEAQSRIQVEALLGRQLVQVPGLDFSVRVERATTERWRVHILTRLDQQLQGERVLEGASCAEVREAAAVAIAMAVTERQPPQEPPAPTVQVLDLAQTAPSNANRRGVPRAESHVTAEATPSPWALALGLGAVMDVGLLPDVGIGAGLLLAGNYGPWGLLARANVFGEQVEEVAALPGVTGEFALWTLGLQACTQSAGAEWLLAGCLGAEWARYRARGGGGVTVAYRRARNSVVVRGDLGLGRPLAQGFVMWLRVGAGMPTAEQDFVVGEGVRVHSVSTLAGRLGLELVYVL